MQEPHEPSHLLYGEPLLLNEGEVFLEPLLHKLGEDFQCPFWAKSCRDGGGEPILRFEYLGVISLEASHHSLIDDI